MHYLVREKAFEEHGASEAQAGIDLDVARIRELFVNFGSEPD